MHATEVAFGRKNCESVRGNCKTTDANRICVAPRRGTVTGVVLAVLKVGLLRWLPRCFYGRAEGQSGNRGDSDDSKAPFV